MNYIVLRTQLFRLLPSGFQGVFCLFVFKIILVLSEMLMNANI